MMNSTPLLALVLVTILTSRCCQSFITIKSPSSASTVILTRRSFFDGNRRINPSEKSLASVSYHLGEVDSEGVGNRRTEFRPRAFLVHWKGEDMEGYSAQFRHVEFNGALLAVLGEEAPATSSGVSFVDALNYDASVELAELKRISFNSAMQYLEDVPEEVTTHALIQTASRCSLVHALYQVVAEEDTYEQLSPAAFAQGGLDDVMVGGWNENSTWCLRVRHYGDMSTEEKATRYGGRARSMKLERKALQLLKPLLLKFGGHVNLNDPDCKIYVFDGLLQQKKVLARRLATGPRTSTIAPVTRICITNTPLCPIAAFSLCNVAGVTAGSYILDPYCGSGATLLAASMIEPTCRSVGIEIAHNGLVNRTDICKDFDSRRLTAPLALIHGDSTDVTVRRQARAAIDHSPFDVILTDPPYGIRESTNDMDPLTELFQSIARDRNNGEPLLRIDGGTVVAFVPCLRLEQDLRRDCLPSDEDTASAGLQLELVREQVLNDKLSRWLVLYSSTIKR